MTKEHFIKKWFDGYRLVDKLGKTEEFKLEFEEDLEAILTAEYVEGVQAALIHGG